MIVINTIKYNSLTFSEYCDVHGIILIDNNTQLDYLTKINMNGYMLLASGVCLGVELIPIKLGNGNLGILPELYFNETKDIRHRLYDLSKLDGEVLTDLKVDFKSTKADNYLEYIDEMLTGDYKYNFNTSGYRPIYTKYSKNTLVVLKDNNTDGVLKVVKYQNDIIECVTLTKKARGKKLVETEYVTQVKVSDIGKLYSILLIVN